MEIKPRKRAHENFHDDNGNEAPLKRRRQINEEQLKLSKLYENLAAESDEVRIDAAKQLIVNFSAENKPAANDVRSAISRLIKGLCSQRKAARVGFSLTLTELLRQLFGQDSNPVAGLDLHVASIIKLVEESTKIEGNVPGKVSPLVGPKANEIVD
jgi:DNA polymerase phi